MMMRATNAYSTRMNDGRTTGRTSVNDNIKMVEYMRCGEAKLANLALPVIAPQMQIRKQMLDSTTIKLD